MTPVRVMRPIALLLDSVNQRLPSGPLVIPDGKLLSVGRGNSVTFPSGVMRPMLSPLDSVNQRLPSGPGVIPCGSPWVGRENSAITPAGVILPMALLPDSVNQRLLSGPGVIFPGELPAPGIGNFLMLPVGVMRP